MRGGSERLQNLISCLRGAWSACEDRDGDLARLGPVRHGPAPEANDHGAVADLVPEQRALLDRLAAGDTIAAAAAAEFLSLRTANRRIAEARQLFGVRTTREAVLAYLRQRGPQP